MLERNFSVKSAKVYGQKLSFINHHFIRKCLETIAHGKTNSTATNSAFGFFAVLAESLPPNTTFILDSDLF